MWLLFCEAKALGVRPSDLVGLTDAYLRYCFDQAILHYGLTVEHRLEEATLSSKERREATKAHTKRKQALEKLLGDTGTKATGFSDPALMFG